MGIELRRAPRVPGDPPTFQRYVGITREPLWNEMLNVVFEPENAEVTAHISVSVWSISNPFRWVRLPTDQELEAVGRALFGGAEFEEDNPHSFGRARHLWAKSRLAKKG